MRLIAMIDNAIVQCNGKNRSGKTYMSTIKDVAEEAGVSVATVSYVLNGKKRVSEAVEKRVWEAAQRLNYRANATARNLRQSKTRIIGYELPSPHGNVSSLMHRFAYGIVVEASKQNYHIITFGTPSTQMPVAQYHKLIRSGRVDGFIIADTNWQDHRVEYLQEHDFPFVTFGRTNSNQSHYYVDVDGFNGIVQIVNHLIEKGHRHVAFIAWPQNSFSGDDRYNGYIQSLKDAGISVQYDLIQRAENTIESAYNATADLFANNQTFTAIVCVSDIIAIGAMQYVQQQGLVVGQDIAITGFDNLDIAQFVTPSLTTVSQPLEEVEREIIRIITLQLEDELTEVEQILLNPKLIIRDSS